MTIRRSRSALVLVITAVCLVGSLAGRGIEAPVARASIASTVAPSIPARRTTVPLAVIRQRALARATAITGTDQAAQEVPALRTRTSDTYVARNGVFTVHQSFQSINYQDASSAWQPIDDTLVAASPALAATGLAYQNAANDFQVAFAATSGASAFEHISHDGATLDLIPAGGQATAATVTGNKITYAGIFAQTDARYTVQNDAVKEELILHDNTAPSSFAFTLLAHGASPQATDALTAGLGFVDATGHLPFTLAPLVATDARGFSTPVSLTIRPTVGVGNAQTLQVQATIPSTWLADPSRVWPVTLDPTVELQPVYDRHIDSGNYGFNLSAYDCAPTGTPACAEKSVDGIGNFATWLPNNQPTVMRTLLQFDLSVLPPDVTLLNATLQAAIPTRAGNGYVDQSMSASVYALTSAWTPQATWAMSDGIHAWNTPGGDYDPSLRAQAVLDYSHDTYTHDATALWNLTTLAQQWYLGQRPNDGLLVRMDDESTNSPRKLEWQNGLQIVYSYIPWQGGAAPGGERAFDPHASLKSDRALITFPQGDGQQMGVNVANGDLEIMRNDVSIPSLGLPNVIQRTYHSMAAVNGATSLGHGWQLSIGGDTSLSVQPTGDAIYLDPTGQGYDIPSAVTNTVSSVITDTATKGSWVGVYGHDGYILNGWNNGADVVSLPSYAGSYSRAAGTTNVWQMNTTDTRALVAASGSRRNAAALSAGTQTQQVITFSARTLITASVYLLNWGASPTSAGETVQVQDAVGLHSYHTPNDGGMSLNNGLWVGFTNLRVGPTQALTVTVIGDPGSSALASALTFDGGAPNGFLRAPGLSAELTQNADGSYALAFDDGLTEHFNVAGQYISSSDRHGNTEQFGYGGGTGGSCGASMLGVITDTVGRATTLGCSGGLVSSITDADGRVVRYDYDASNNLAYFTDHAGGVTHYQYNASSLPVTVTDPIGNQTVITYDNFQRVSAVRDGAGSVTTFSYGVTGTNTTTVTNALGAQVVYTLDPATGEILSLRDPDNNVTRFTYDGNMQLLTTIDPLGHVVTNTTTSVGEETSTTSPLGDGTAMQYNALHEPTVVTDTQGYTTTTQYNAVGDPLTVTDPLSNTTVYTTSSSGLRLAMTDGNGHTTQYGYDAFGETVAVTDALGRVSSMVYDTTISRLSSITDPKHQTTHFSYDNEDRPTVTTYQDGSTVTNYLDADGNITETVDSAGTTLFRYDGDNRLVQQIYPDGTVVQYSYDAAGHIQSKSEPGLPLTSYGYDLAGNLITVTNSLWGPIVYHYDAANRLTSLSYPNGVTTTYQEDADNRMIALTETVTSTTLLADSFSYARPGGGTWGLRSSETRNEKGTITNFAYSYDADSRLTGVSQTGASTATYSYGYDAVGNLTNNNGTIQSYDAANQITAAGAVTFTYDTDGNQTATSKSTHPAWAYNAQNRTTAYSDTATTDTFLSWASGQRAKKTTVQGGTTTSGVFDGDLYRQTTPVSTTIYYERDPNGRLLVLTDGSKVYYYGLDGHGSVNNLTTTSGAVVNRYHYDAYGNSTYRSENASLANPWQYAGGYYDAESGLYLLGVRYYDPKLGRFLQQDPAGSGATSQYAYAESDPCNNSDPTGMKTCSLHLSPQQIATAQERARWAAVIDSSVALIAKTVGWFTNFTLVFAPEVAGPVRAAAGATEIVFTGAALSNTSIALALQQYVNTGVTVSYQDPSISLGPIEIDLPCAPPFN